MANVTINQLMELKRKASETRDKSLRAEATMAEVESNIESYKAELKKLGIKDVENAEEEIKSLEQEASNLYEEAKEKLSKYL